MKEIYEVFRKGTFVAVAKPGSKASRELFKLGLYSGDVRLEPPQFWPFMEKVGFVEKVK